MILTTGADRRATITIVRSLGRNGLKVCVGNYKSFGTAFLSRYCYEKFLYPNPQKNPNGYYKSVMEKINSGRFKVIMPVNDFEIFPLLLNKDDIEKHCIFPFVNFETFLKTVNKKETIDIANKIGIRTPETIILDSKTVLNKIANDINYPSVIKPKSQTDWNLEKDIRTRYVTEKNYVNNKNEFIAFFKKNKEHENYMIQEYIRGIGAGTAFLFNKGQLRASFAYKRIREYPITGGPSTIRMSIKHDEMTNAGRKLLEKLKWHGIAMVEFKLDKKGMPVLMEINGRFWGSIALAYKSGVDFPYLLYKMAIDGDIVKQKNYETGVICRWLIPGDLLNFYFKLKANRKDNIDIFKNFFKFRGTHYDYIDSNDPLPIIGAFLTSTSFFQEFLKGKRSIYGEYR
jgi:predicted ATP-grasp superfamily ATP-dependent carboligase